MKENFLQRRVIKPLMRLFRQGITPEKLALSLALSAALAVIPAFGWSVGLCGLAGLALGLNLPAMQAVNYFLYPAQVALLLPFFRLGEKLFRRLFRWRMQISGTRSNSSGTPRGTRLWSGPCWRRLRLA